MRWPWLSVRRWAIFRTVSPPLHHGLDDGPYRYLRHPSYAGSLLTFAGLGLALGNWLSLLLAVCGALVGFTRRIRIEEATLHAHFGEDYTAYARQTWRLLPFIW